MSKELGYYKTDENKIRSIFDFISSISGGNFSFKGNNHINIRDYQEVLKESPIVKIINKRKGIFINGKKHTLDFLKEHSVIGVIIYLHSLSIHSPNKFDLDLFNEDVIIYDIFNIPGYINIHDTDNKYEIIADFIEYIIGLDSFSLPSRFICSYTLNNYNYKTFYQDIKPYGLEHNEDDAMLDKYTNNTRSIQAAITVILFMYSEGVIDKYFLEDLINFNKIELNQDIITSIYDIKYNCNFNFVF